ncbi:hypothetical protein [Streptomyces sp. NRRL F-5126]|uniref:hypothetical protein n=1 Tax=Streptomyces sp. NRRL F-5126 TaxID=1463857 RepID=UPI000AD71C14|nr:hypothetical protein [Streptomyces sp. NRRL F-5126]
MALRSARAGKTSEGPGRGAPAPGSAAKKRGKAVPDGAIARPTAGRWLLRGKDGRLTAYAQVDDAAVWWTETVAGGPYFTGPERLPAGGTALSMTTAQSAEGYAYLTALRRRPATDGGEPLIDVVNAIQYQSGRPLRTWQSLVSPYRDHAKAARMGVPAALLDARSGLHVYIRTAEGRLAYRRQTPKGRFNNWERAGVEGTPIKGEAYAVLGDDGVIDVLGPAAGRVLHWRLRGHEGEIERVTELELDAAVAPGTLSSERTSPSHRTYFWRDAGSARVRAWRPGSDPADLGGPGSGPVSVLRTPVDGVDCTILAGRGQDGRPALAAYPTEDEEAGLTWVPSGEPCRGAPALALDGAGRVTLAAIGEDGSLRIARQKAESGLALEAWTRPAG